MNYLTKFLHIQYKNEIKTCIIPISYAYPKKKKNHLIPFNVSFQYVGSI